MTLEKIFTGLKDEWLDRIARANASLRQHLDTVEVRAPMLRAVIAHNRGDQSAIPRLLRSEYQLTQEDQQTLADFLEGGFSRPKQAGRHKSNERWVGMQADRLLSEWKRAAKVAGLSTYGATEAMRDQSIEFIVANFVPATENINRDAVASYMTKRGKSRRN